MRVHSRGLDLALLLLAACSANLPAGERPSGLAGAGEAAAELRRDRRLPAAEPARLRLPIALVHCPQPQSRDSAAGQPLSLPPRGAPAAATAIGGRRTGSAVATTAASLAIVVGLFLLLVWVQRRISPRRSSLLPGEVFETLGRVPLNARQQMHLVRVGNKLLLLAVTATAAETLTEITDPREIARLSDLCRHSRPDNMAASFREILAQLSQQPAAAGLHYAAGR